MSDFKRFSFVTIHFCNMNITYPHSVVPPQIAFGYRALSLALFHSAWALAAMAVRDDMSSVIDDDVSPAAAAPLLMHWEEG